MHLKQDPCLYFGEKYPFCAVTRARAKLDTVRARFNDGFHCYCMSLLGPSRTQNSDYWVTNIQRGDNTDCWLQLIDELLMMMVVTGDS